MGNGMNKVLPGLYVGNYRDSKDQQQLDKHNITHIVAIHDSPRRLLPDKHYLCVMASDTPDQNLSQYFSVCNDFIHAARLRDGNVLIHCLAGMSRSVTVTVAYIMSVTQLNWKEALKVVRTGRSVANPNLGFQIQLQDYEQYKLADERKRLRERFPTLAMELSDMDQCSIALTSYQQLLSNNDICEGNCVRGRSCPTGLCNTDTRPGIFRRKSNTSRSRLSVVQSSSCPASPRQGLRSNSSVTSLRQMDAALSCIEATTSTGLHRSASTVSAIRPRSSPSGFYSYTGSTHPSTAPPSVHGSRVDLSNIDKGSAIYLGCSPPRNSQSFLGGAASSSTTNQNPINPTASGAISKSKSSSTQTLARTKSPRSTPPASPKKSQTSKTHSKPSATPPSASPKSSPIRSKTSASKSTLEKSKQPTTINETET